MTYEIFKRVCNRLENFKAGDGRLMCLIKTCSSKFGRTLHLTHNIHNKHHYYEFNSNVANK